jgi:hypothetical protein
MTPRRVATYRLDDELLEGLHRIWVRDGVPPSEQVRRAVRQWLESKGEGVRNAEKSDRKRATTRKRS